MSYHKYDTPKNRSIYEFIGVGRISTDHQEELSLGDQEALYGNELERRYKDDKFNVTVIAGRGSGQDLLREDFLRLQALVSSGKYDAVIAEDLGRICRRMDVYKFCELAEDNRTRVITINDCVDTADPNWRQMTIMSAFRHETFCHDTSKRIRRSLRNRFMQGQIFQCPIYGYLKPGPKAKDSEVTKDPEAESIYEEWFSRLESGHNYSQIADWLNASNVPTGPYCRSDKWSSKMVVRITNNPILKGERRRNDRVTVRVNKSGRSKTIKAPEEEKLSRMVSHLAFIEPDRYDRVVRMLTKRNAKYKRSENEKNDPRAGIPKRKTLWPAQHIRCGVCGRLFVRGGHGDKERLVCSGASTYKCWNATSIKGTDVALAVAEKVRELIRALPDFDSEWVSEYELQREALRVSSDGELSKLAEQLAAREKSLGNLFVTLEKLGVSDATVNRIRETETEIANLKDKIADLNRRQVSQSGLPSLEEIQQVSDEVFGEIAVESTAFSQLMRRAIDEFFVLPYRLIGGGHVQPRVTFRISPINLVSEVAPDDFPFQQLTSVVDLVKNPERVTLREEVMKLIEKGIKVKDIAQQMNTSATAVANARNFDRLLKEQGVTDPWLPVTCVEDVYDYFPRVRHARFNFQPLAGFEVTRHPSD